TAQDSGPVESSFVTRRSLAASRARAADRYSPRLARDRAIVATRGDASTARSLARGSVEQLAGGVGVTCVSGGFVDQVQEHPPKIDPFAPSVWIGSSAERH